MRGGDNRVLQLLEMEVGRFSMSCWFNNEEDNLEWRIMKFYGPTMKNEMKEFWVEFYPKSTTLAAP